MTDEVMMEVHAIKDAIGAKDGNDLDALLKEIQLGEARPKAAGVQVFLPPPANPTDLRDDCVAADSLRSPMNLDARPHTRPRMRASSRLSAPLAAAIASFSSPASATGSEMAGLALVLPLLLLTAAVALLALTWIVQRLLPKAWPRARRWLTAVVVAPAALGILVLLASGPGFLQMQLARLLLH